MSHSFLHDEIRKVSKATMIAGAVVLLGIFGAMVPFKDYWINFVRGPAVMTGASLAQVSSLAKSDVRHVRLSPEEVVDTGFQRTQKYTDKRGRETRVEEFHLYVVGLGDRAILLETVDSPESLRETSLELELKPLDPGLKAQVLPKLVVDNPLLKKSLLPFMAGSGRDYRESGWYGVFILGGVALAALFCVVFGLRGMMDPRSHGTFKRLKAYGDPEQLARKIDEEIIGKADLYEGKGRMRSGTLRLTRNWLIFSQVFRLTIVPLDSVVWAHKHVLRYNFVLKIVSLWLYTVNGKKIQASVSTMAEAPCDELVAELQRRRPWINIGYYEEYEKAWKKDRAGMIQALEQRKKAATSKTA